MENPPKKRGKTTRKVSFYYMKNGKYKLSSKFYIENIEREGERKNCKSNKNGLHVYGFCCLHKTKGGISKGL